MRNGYTDEQLDAIEKLMDQLPRLPGMFQAGEDGWEDAISGLYDIIQAKRAAIQFRGSIVAHLKDSLGLVDAELDTGEFAPVCPKSDWPGVDEGYAASTEPYRLHSLSQEGRGMTKYTTNSPQVTPTQDAPYPSFLAMALNAAGVDTEQIGENLYCHTFTVQPRVIVDDIAQGIADGFAPNWQEIVSDQLEQETLTEAGAIVFDDYREDVVWPEVSYPENEKPADENFVLVECPSRFEGKRWVLADGLVFQGVDVAESGQDETAFNHTFTVQGKEIRAGSEIYNTIFD